MSPILIFSNSGLRTPILPPRESSGKSQKLDYPFFRLPIEIRNDSYRYFAISRINCGSCPQYWRPLDIDRHKLKGVGYFDKDTILLLLLTCKHFHDEAAAVLYGENTFAFHISGLEKGPVAFLDWLAPRYVQILRTVYIHAGYHLHGLIFQPWLRCFQTEIKGPTSKRKPIIEASRQLSIFVALLKQAWPYTYNVCVTRNDTVIYIRRAKIVSNNDQATEDWPASSYQLLGDVRDRH